MMNYCNQIHYSVITVSEGTFPERIDEALAKLPKEEIPVRLVFFGSPESNEQYLIRRELIGEKLTALFGDSLPAFSYVAQPPLDGKLVLEVHGYKKSSEDQIFYGKHSTSYVIVENPQLRMLFCGGFQGSDLHASITQQSVQALDFLHGLLLKEHFPISSIIRQWNYIEKITAIEDGKQHYQSFNNARSQFYAQETWKNGYPAATGIGASFGGVLVDADAVIFRTANAFATPIDNRLQIAAHAYSDSVLEHSGKELTTPKFERAKSITVDHCRHIYISGTAAIRGELSLKGVGLAEQLKTTMENIAELIGKAHLTMLRIYLKHASDYSEAKCLMDHYSLHIPISFMQADVCRDELLIEIEGIASET